MHSGQQTCPPRSQSLMVTAPRVTLRMLNPTVGIMSSWKAPVAMTFTSDVLPAFWSPISESSISFLKKRLHSKTASPSSSTHSKSSKWKPQHPVRMYHQDAKRQRWVPSQPVEKSLNQACHGVQLP